MELPPEMLKVYAEARADQVKKIADAVAAGKVPDRWNLDAYLITLAVEEYTTALAGAS